MKKYMTPILVALVFASGCNTNEEKDVPNLEAKILSNVAYGTDPEQKMDVYLPANRTSETKVFVLVHGGGWSGGSRTDMSYAIPMLKTYFPNHAVVNLDYRLGSQDSPAFPKQIEDIGKAIDFLKESDYQIGNSYGLIGASAGAHLSLLYAYKFDPDNEVQAVCSIVGPTDFTDPAYTGNPLFQYGLGALVGNANYATNPEVFIEVSPRTHVSASSAATIQFNGGQDPLIPVSQATRLKERLDANNVYNEYYLYPNGGHFNWDAPTLVDFQTKLVAFFNARF